MKMWINDIYPEEILIVLMTASFGKLWGIQIWDLNYLSGKPNILDFLSALKALPTYIKAFMFVCVLGSQSI